MLSLGNITVKRLLLVVRWSFQTAPTAKCCVVFLRTQNLQKRNKAASTTKPITFREVTCKQNSPAYLACHRYERFFGRMMRAGRSVYRSHGARDDEKIMTPTKMMQNGCDLRYLRICALSYFSTLRYPYSSTFS